MYYLVNDKREVIDFYTLLAMIIEAITISARNKKNLEHLARPDVRAAGEEEEDTGRDRDLRNVFRRADILTTCQSNSCAPVDLQCLQR